MNKKFIILCFALILGFQLISAAGIEVKSDVLKGENLIAKISGNFVEPLTLENIAFYRRHLPTSLGFYELFEIEGDYYVYAQVPLEKITDNYSIVIEGATYRLGADLVSEDIVGNFNILDEEVAFQVSPGILVSENNYSINLFNLEFTKITIEYEKEIPGLDIGESSFWDDLFGEKEIIEGTSKSISLLSGEEKEVLIEPKNEAGFQEIEFSYENETYSVLAYVEGEILNESEEEVEEVIEEIIIEEVEEDEEAVVEEKPTFWDLVLGREDVIEEGEEVIIDEKFERDLKTCEEMGYIVCTEDETCEGDTDYSRNAICCLGDCIEVKTTSVGKTIGWVIIIALAFFVTWFLKKKYQQTKTSPGVLIKKK